jgi:putative NADH-flavin reductase
MKIVIFGASGKTGSLLVERALVEGHDVTAYIRTAGSINIDHPKLKIVVGNLNETLKLTDAIAGKDACISALGGGSLTKHSPEILTGIENIVRIMEQEVVPRFIYLSSFGAGESISMVPAVMRFFVMNLMLRVPLADHNSNERRIMSSKLHYTIVRPGALTDGEFTGKFRFGITKPEKGNTSISRADLAAFMIAQVTDYSFNKKAVWLFRK